MMNFALVGAGGAVGAMARYAVGAGYGRLFGPAHAYLATLAINVVGGLLMGVLVGALALKVSDAGERWRLLLGVGVLGGFTTFSAFALEAVSLLQKKSYGTFSAYVAASVGLSILGVLTGLWLARRGLA